MSPLQYQKPIRLQEARRLMVSESYDAAEAGYKVGYDDASHFNREYKRHSTARESTSRLLSRHASKILSRSASVCEEMAGRKDARR